MINKAGDEEVLSGKLILSLMAELQVHLLRAASNEVNEQL